ncbi:uncharacterized protein [Antennarius striatus]|uniref:uncharacterized protein isoform X2 n=1 Tax=Antennarius striatus TaxID=241820 RepID=UPI0035B1B62F
MLVPALLQTSLVLWLARQTLQGGVKPQTVSWGRALPARGVGIGVKPGVGALGAVGNRYGSKAMKTGFGRYPGAQHGVGYRALGLGSRAGLRPGGYGTQGAYGAGLGMGTGLGTGLTNGLGMALGQGAKRAYGAGLGTPPGYGTFAGIGYPGARPGYGAGNYLGANLGAGGYGPGLGQGAYLGGAAGKLGAGYGDGATGYLGAMGGNGYGGDAAKALAAGYGNGYSDGYGGGLGYTSELADGAQNKAGKREALGTGAYGGQGAYGALGAGLESNGGKYGGGAAQVPYGNAPVIPTGLEGDVGYLHSPQQLALSAEGAKTANKYGAGGFGGQQAGYGAQMGAAQEALGEPARKFSGLKDALGNGYKG